MYYCLFIRLFGYFINLRVPGRALGFHRRDSRGDWHLYRRPSADDRRGFPKPGRCIKHNRQGVFPVGITQSCGNPSFQLSDILFFFFIILVLSLFSLFSPTSVYYLSSSSLFFRFFFHFVFTPRANSKKKKYVSDRNGHIHVQCIWFSSFIPSITFFSF